MQRKYSRLEDCFFAVLKRFRGKLRFKASFACVLAFDITLSSAK